MGLGFPFLHSYPCAFFFTPLQLFNIYFRGFSFELPKQYLLCGVSLGCFRRITWSG